MSELTVIEINGVKLEVDLRTARRIDNLRVGSRVKVLIKGYSEYSVYQGVVVGFDPFESLPTINVIYLVESYSGAELKALAYNSNSKDCQIVAANDDDAPVDKGKVVSCFEREVEKKQREIEDLQHKMRYFERHFGQVFNHYAKTPAPIDNGDDSGF